MPMLVPQLSTPYLLVGLVIAAVVLVLVWLVLRRSPDAQPGAQPGAQQRGHGTPPPTPSQAPRDTPRAQQAAAASPRPVRAISFACEAGMATSAMGASVLRDKLTRAGLDEVQVRNTAVPELHDDQDLVVTLRSLADRVRAKAPSAELVLVDNFMSSPRYDEVVRTVRERRPAGPAAAATPAAATAPAAEPQLVTDETVLLDGHAADRTQAIRLAGELLAGRGAVEADYVAAMLQREESVSTYMGNLLAIPHGTIESKNSIHFSAMSFVRLAEPVDWNGHQVRFVVGIAAHNREHLQILGRLARLFSDNSRVQALGQAATPGEVIDILGRLAG